MMDAENHEVEDDPYPFSLNMIDDVSAIIHTICTALSGYYELFYITSMKVLMIWLRCGIWYKIKCGSIYEYYLLVA